MEKMVNIWEYANAKPRVKIISVDGEKYVGDIIAVLDAEEIEGEQDCMDIELDNGVIVSFYPDEIESIEVLNG